jgi:3-methyladenine DNA glycosylase/8-oxoguanine DNA glycosylase
MQRFEYGQKEIDHLRRKDPKLGRAIERIGMLEREVMPDLFEALASCIVAQQVSGKAADAIWGKLKAKLGKVTPKAVAAAGDGDLRACGLSGQKLGYLRGIADGVLDGSIDLEALRDLPNAEVAERLTALRGVGRWTVEMLLIFSLMRPDVISFGDLGIRRGMMRLYGLKTLSREQFDRYAKRYSPFGTVASMYLWVIAES